MDTETLNSTLEIELAAVTSRLTEIAHQLDEPLNQLVLSQIRHASPHRRAAVVLAFSVGESDDAVRVSRRVALAAALEMLYIAQRVHHLLLNQDTEAMDKSLMGSIILAGDYCFSRSADLAVLTEDPAVVTIFSSALKRLSENNLRDLFDQEEQGRSSDAELLTSGIEAALLLAGATPSANDRAREFAHQWAAVMLADAADPDRQNWSPFNRQQAERIRLLLTSH